MGEGLEGQALADYMGQNWGHLCNERHGGCLCDEPTGHTGDEHRCRCGVTWGDEGPAPQHSVLAAVASHEDAR